MSISKSLARLTPIAAACCAVFAAVPASAAVIASFDPAYNAPLAPNPDPDLNNVGFKGFIKLDLSPGCSSSSGFSYTTNGGYYPYGTCAVTVEGAHIDFYNSTTDQYGTSPLTSIDLPGTFFAQDYVYGVYFDPTGQLAGFDTNLSDSFQVKITDLNPLAPIHYNDDPSAYSPPYGSVADGVQYPDQLQLYFVSGHAPSCDGECTDPGFLTNTNSQGSRSTSAPAMVTFRSDVPEPESLALTLLGFGALLFSRRRKKGTSGRPG